MVVHNNIPKPKKLDTITNPLAVNSSQIENLPPKAVLLTEDYTRGSKKTQSLQEKRGIARTVAYSNDSKFIEPKMNNNKNSLPSASSQTIILQRSYKSKHAKVK